MKQRILISLPKDIYEEVRKVAYENHTSMAEVVRQALMLIIILKRAGNEEYSQTVDQHGIIENII